MRTWTSPGSAVVSGLLFLFFRLVLVVGLEAILEDGVEVRLDIVGVEFVVVLVLLFLASRTDAGPRLFGVFVFDDVDDGVVIDDECIVVEAALQVVLEDGDEVLIVEAFFVELGIEVLVVEIVVGLIERRLVETSVVLVVEVEVVVFVVGGHEENVPRNRLGAEVGGQPRGCRGAYNTGGDAFLPTSSVALVT